MASSTVVDAVHRLVDPVAPGASRETRLALLTNLTSWLAELKRMNRDAYDAQAQRHMDVAEARQTMDDAARTLEVHRFEASALCEQIEACRDLALVYEQLPVAAESMDEALDTQAKHTLMLERLQSDLDERRRMEQEEKALREQLAQLETQRSASHQTLTQLERDMYTLWKSLQRHTSTPTAAP